MEGFLGSLVRHLTCSHHFLRQCLSLPSYAGCVLVDASRPNSKEESSLHCDCLQAGVLVRGKQSPQRTTHHRTSLPLSPACFAASSAAASPNPRQAPAVLHRNSTECCSSTRSPLQLLLRPEGKEIRNLFRSRCSSLYTSPSPSAVPDRQPLPLHQGPNPPPIPLNRNPKLRASIRPSKPKANSNSHSNRLNLQSPLLQSFFVPAVVDTRQK